MDLDKVTGKLSEIRGASSENMRLLRLIDPLTKVGGENLTAGQKTNIKNRALANLQVIRDAMITIEAEIVA